MCVQRFLEDFNAKLQQLHKRQIDSLTEKPQPALPDVIVHTPSAGNGPNAHAWQKVLHNGTDAAHFYETPPSNATLCCPTVSRSHGLAIPKLIYQTVRHKDHLYPHERSSVDSWVKTNVGYEHRLYDNNDLTAYVRDFHPGLLATFDKMYRGVERADLWRYLVVLRDGGVYSDSDTLCVKPIDLWIPDPAHHMGLIVGLESFGDDVTKLKHGWANNINFCQWTFAARPNHPILRRVVSMIVERLHNASKMSHKPRDFHEVLSLSLCLLCVSVCLCFCMALNAGSDASNRAWRVD